ncbi:MAG: immunoglobulin domain-containing protein [Verrucomicrobiota bacterium]
MRAWLILSGLGLVCGLSPSELRAGTVSSGPASLLLGWNYTSSGEMGFGIDRATSLSGPWTTVATVPAPLTTYLDTGLQASTTFYYRVWAYNAAGDSDYSNIAGVTTPAAAAPVIQSNPVSQTVVAGTNVTFSVVASGATPMAYQWYFNKTKLRNQTASSLKLNSVRPSQGGNYFVTVSNSAGSVTSSVAKLTVVSAPGTPRPRPGGPPIVVLQQPVITAIRQSGGRAMISFGGTTGLRYTLEYKDSLAGSAWTPLPGAVTGTGGVVSLTDSNATPVARFYHVRVEIAR